MFFLVLCKLFLWSRCQYINVVDAQSGDQSPKPEEYQLGIKQCEERCLDIGECRGFSYDSFALRCSLALEEDNFQYKSTARKCGTSFCKGGERCLTTRKSHYACVSFVAQEEEHLPETDVKLDLEDLGSIKTHHNFYGCTMFKTGKRKMRKHMFLLSLNQLIAIDTESLIKSGTWQIVHNSKLKLTGLTNGLTKISRRSAVYIFIMGSSSHDDQTWLVSIRETALSEMEIIDLDNRKPVTPRTKSSHYHLSVYAERLYLISTRPGHHHELSIALLESKDTSYELKQLFSINTGFVRVTDKQIDFFPYGSHAFVLVKNVLLRWTLQHAFRRMIDLRNSSMKMYRWDSPQNTVCSVVCKRETLYLVDSDSHVLKAPLCTLLKQ